MPKNASQKDLDKEYFVDFIPNLIKQGHAEYAEEFLQKRFKRKLPHCVARWGELPPVTVRVKIFEQLFRQARDLYIDGYFEAAVALCGMTVEALCISIAEERVPEGSFKDKLTDPEKSARNKIKLLRPYFRVDKSKSLLNQILDIRNHYLHLHEMDIDPKEVLECINKLHLVVLAEYGLIPTRGKFRRSTKEDIVERAKRMGITLK